MKNITISPHTLRKEDYAACVHVDGGVRTILKVYRKTLKSSMTAVLHFLLGIGARCYEEKHDEHIKALQEGVHSQAGIIVKYLEKYGKLRAKDQ